MESWTVEARDGRLEPSYVGDQTAASYLNFSLFGSSRPLSDLRPNCVAVGLRCFPFCGCYVLKHILLSIRHSRWTVANITPPVRQRTGQVASSAARKLEQIQLRFRVAFCGSILNILRAADRPTNLLDQQADKRASELWLKPEETGRFFLSEWKFAILSSLTCTSEKLAGLYEGHEAC